MATAADLSAPETPVSQQPATTSAAPSQTTAQQSAAAASAVSTATTSTAAGTRGLEYTLINNGTAYAVSNGPVARQGTVVIPATYDNLPVVMIANQGFHFINITEIIIPNSIIIIGEGAFAQDKGLTSITIPASVTEIWVQAFRGCDNLTSVTFQGSIKSFYDGNFPGDLRAKYKKEGPGTYTRPDVKSRTWTKQQ